MFYVLVFLFIVLVIGMVVLSALFPWMSKTQRTWEDIHKTKPQKVTKEDRARLMTGHYLNMGKIDETDESYILPQSVRYTNTACFGPIKSGKTKQMVLMAAQDIANRSSPVVFFDPQRDLTEELISICQAFKRDYVIFPDCGFNPLAGYGSARKRAILFANIYSQVSRSGKTGDSIFYSEIAQTFIMKVVPLFEAIYKCPMILQELLLLTESQAFRDKLMKDAPPGIEKQSYFSTFGSWSEKDFRDNLTGISIFIQRLTPDDQLINLLNQRNAPTLQECIEQKKVIIIRAGGYPNTIGASIGLLFQVSLQEYIEHRDESGNMDFLALYIDELPMYLNENFHTLVSTGRKQKVSLTLGFQSLKQLYPYQEVIMQNVRTWCVRGGLNYEDCEFVSKTIGEVARMEFAASTPFDAKEGAGSERATPKYMPKLTPSDIYRIPEKKYLLLTPNPLFDRQPDEHRMMKEPSIEGLEKIVANYPYTYRRPNVPAYPPPHVWVKK